MATSWIPFDYADDDNDDGNIIASRPVSLAPGTQYTFQIEVRNALDTFVSPPRTFHTLAGIPIPSNEPPKYNTSNELRGNTYPARFITSSHAVLRGGLLGDGWLPSKSRFHYWADGGPTLTTSWTAFDEDNIIASRRVSLEPDTQYTFQLEVRNAEDTYECLPRTFRTLAN